MPFWDRGEEFDLLCATMHFQRDCFRRSQGGEGGGHIVLVINDDRLPSTTHAKTSWLRWISINGLSELWVVLHVLIRLSAEPSKSSNRNYEPA